MRVFTILLIGMLFGGFTIYAQSHSTGSVAGACPGMLPARLVIGERGRVLPGDSNNLRAEPDMQAQRIGQIPGEGIFTVLDGFVCADGYPWWQVEYNGLTGWTVEGALDYWVEPLAASDAGDISIEFEYPPELASDISLELVPEADAIGGRRPEHLVYTFEDYPYTTTVMRQRADISAYPVVFFEAAEAATMREQLAQLQQILEEQPELPVELPDDPSSAGAMLMLEAQQQYLTFANGTGIRRLVFYTQDTMPLTNEQLIYNFQGLTDDGTHYVTANFIITAAILPDTDADFVPPAELNIGRRFQRDVWDAVYDDYLAIMTEKLEELAVEDFAPSLTALDSMIGSIHVMTTDNTD